MELCIIAVSPSNAEGARSELCDGCFHLMRLGKPGADELDEAEDAGQSAVLLCMKCALRRFGAAGVAKLAIESEEYKQRRERGA